MANIGLISLTARYALDHGYHVIIEGILHAARYAAMLTQLASDHRGVPTFYYPGGRSEVGSGADLGASRRVLALGTSRYTLGVV